MIKNLYVEEKISCPKEIIYTKDNLPNFRAPFISPEESYIEDKEVTLPVLMKDGSIGSVTLTDWMVYAEFDGFDRYFSPVSIDNKVEPSDRHIELWINENSNNIQIIYAVPSFPVEVICVDRNFNADGLYLFLREAGEIKKFTLNLKDESDCIRTGYEEVLEGTREEVITDYLHFHLANTDENISIDDIDCEEAR